MRTRLDQLLADIASERTIETAFRGADQALNTFSMRSGRIDRWTDFEDCLGKFHRHVLGHVLRIQGKAEWSEEFDRGFAGQLLRKEYGSNGLLAAFEISRTGTEGGLYRVLQSMAQEMATEHAKNWIASLIYLWWQKLSPEQERAVPDEYVKKFGHLLPSEITECGAVRIRVNIRKVLEEHPWLIRRLRRLGR